MSAGRAPHGGAIVRRGRMVQDRYTTVSNTLARDRSLSYKAAGMYLEIASHREGWEISVAALAREGRGNGREAVLEGLRELEEHGYLYRYQERRQDGTMGQWVYEISDDPLPVDERSSRAARKSAANAPQQETGTSEPEAGYPTPVEPDPVHPGGKKTKEKKTKKKKTSTPVPVAVPLDGLNGTAPLIPAQSPPPAAESIPADEATDPLPAAALSEAQRRRAAELLDLGMGKTPPAPPKPSPAPRVGAGSAGCELLTRIAAAHRAIAPAGIGPRRIVLRGKPLIEQAGHLDALLAAGLDEAAVRREIGAPLPEQLAKSYAALIAHRVRELVLAHQPPGSPDAPIGGGAGGAREGRARPGYCRTCSNSRLVRLPNEASGEGELTTCPDCLVTAPF